MTEKKLLHLIISKVDGPVFDGGVVSVTLPGIEGEMTVLPEHEAFISPLRAGTITVRKNDATVESFEVESGTFEISGNQATVLI